MTFRNDVENGSLIPNRGLIPSKCDFSGDGRRGEKNTTETQTGYGYLPSQH